MATTEFLGRVAIVTGGGSGIGRAVCQLLAEAGARVAVCDVNEKAARDTVDSMHGSGQHVALAMDVRARASVDAGLQAATHALQATPSLLVNAAGITRGAYFLDMTEDDFTAVLDVNLKGTFLVGQAVCRAMVAAGVPGVVVNLASLAGKVAFPRHCQYGASKAAVISLTKTMAKEMATKGVRVNCVMPGPIDTPMMALPQHIIDTVVALNPMGRMGQPMEVARVVKFLLSEDSSFMLGACVEVGGGHDI